MDCCATWRRPSAADSAITAARPGCRSASRNWTSCSCAGADAAEWLNNQWTARVTDSVADDHRPTAVCLFGPTAAGKTALALDLCKFHPFEIVSVDSAL